MERNYLSKSVVRIGVLLSLAVGLPLIPAHAKPFMPMNAPVARLLKNVSEYVKRNPRDPGGYYTLGRVHYYTFAAPARQTMPVTRFSPDDSNASLPGAAPFGNPGKIPDEARKGEGKPLSPAEKKSHIQAAIANLRQAIALEQRGGTPAEVTRKGLSELTLACVYEEGKANATKSWREEAIRYYRLAYERSRQDELSRPTAPIFGIETLISNEAANSYLRLVKQRGVLPSEKTKVAEVEKAAQRIAHLPPSNAVTPIVFSLARTQSLSSLVAPQPSGMAFDLDGSARPGQRYSAWPRSTTGILVWDPAHTGRITSGRQLFGNATWWMFWQNGYRALQSLDDNADGWLTGNELQSLGVWTDANSSGKCDRGKVRTVSKTGIVGVNVRETRRIRNGWTTEAGIRSRNGDVLPTYDWIAETIPLKE